MLRFEREADWSSLRIRRQLLRPCCLQTKGLLIFLGVSRSLRLHPPAAVSSGSKVWQLLSL